MTDQVSWIKRLEEERAKKAAKEQPSVFEPPPPVQQPDEKFKPEDIPDVLGDRDEEQDEIDRILDGVSILDAYNRWCGKSKPNPGNKREGIKVSCPDPAHPDKDPSAWLNLDKDLYNCAGCDVGGDIYTIAALNKGYPVPPTGADFHRLRKEMVEDLGYTVKKVAGNQEIIVPPEEEPEPEPTQPDESGGADKADEEPASSSGGALASVTPLPSGVDEDDPDAGVEYPSIDWRKIVKPDTFLWEYMEATTNGDLPEEYHFWQGLLALGHAIGRNVRFSDFPDILGNLQIVLLGGTGVGKSRSNRYFWEVVQEVCPFRETGTETQGVKRVVTSMSGEHLIDAFSYEGKDPANTKISLGYQTVNGVAYFSEFSQLITAANRQSSTLKNAIMDLSDGYGEVTTGSRTHGDVIAKDPFCSVLSTTQPRAIRTLLTRADADSGFINRWIFAGGKPKPRIYFGGVHSGVVIDLAAAKEELKLVRGWAGIERILAFDEEAQPVATRFFQTSLDPLVEDDSGLLSRLMLTFKKLYLLFAANERSSVVTKDHVIRANQLFNYLIECYGIVGENIGLTQSQEVQGELMRHIVRIKEATGKGPTAADLVKRCKRKNWSLDQIKKSLDVMESLGLIESVKPKSNMGRPTIRFQAVGE